MGDTATASDHVILQRIEQSVAVTRGLVAQSAVIRNVAEKLIEAYRHGGKAILFGNGGSAADAQHIAAEFVGRYYLDRSPMPALALTENVSSLTGIGNDYGFEQIFARQVEALGDPGDIAIGLSTSGNSANVVTGLTKAKQLGLVTVALTGATGGRLAQVPGIDYYLRMPSADTPRVQEAHTFICHLWSEFVEAAVASGSGVVQSVPSGVKTEETQ